MNNNVSKDIVSIDKKQLYDQITFSRKLLERITFCLHYAWAIPSEKAINQIVKFIGTDKVIEIGAGLGLWAYLLSIENIDIIATDDESWKLPFYKFYNVITMDYATALKQYADRNVLLTIWPVLDGKISDDMLNKFAGNKLIYIGEPEGDATGSAEFFRLLKEHWKLIQINDIPIHSGMFDKMYLYEKLK